jgi:hypothetical protein
MFECSSRTIAITWPSARVFFRDSQMHLMRSQQEIVVLRYVPTSLSIFPCSCLIDLDSLIASSRFVGKTHLAFRSRTRRFCDELWPSLADLQQAIMIGDSITDIHTARATGIPVIAVEFGYSESPITQFDPDGTISHFSQLPGDNCRRFLCNLMAMAQN